MVIDLAAAPDVRDVPGVEIRPFRREDARRLNDVINESFAEEWGFQPRPYEVFEEHRLNASWARPDLWWVAVADGRMVGETVCDWKRNGDWGWVGGIGVLPAWRGRGIGEALLRHAFRRFYELGERRVALGVDADNPTGATRLYERLGMRVLWRADLFEKDLRA